MDIGGHAETSDLSHYLHKLESIDHPRLCGVQSGEGLSAMFSGHTLFGERKRRNRRRRRGGREEEDKVSSKERMARLMEGYRWTVKVNDMKIDLK